MVALLLGVVATALSPPWDACLSVHGGSSTNRTAPVRNKPAPRTNTTVRRNGTSSSPSSNSSAVYRKRPGNATAVRTTKLYSGTSVAPNATKRAASTKARSSAVAAKATKRTPARRAPLRPVNSNKKTTTRPANLTRPPVARVAPPAVTNVTTAESVANATKPSAKNATVVTNVTSPTNVTARPANATNTTVLPLPPLMTPEDAAGRDEAAAVASTSVAVPADYARLARKARNGFVRASLLTFTCFTIAAVNRAQPLTSAVFIGATIGAALRTAFVTLLYFFYIIQDYRPHLTHRFLSLLSLAHRLLRRPVAATALPPAADTLPP